MAPGGIASGSTATVPMPAPTTRWPSNRTSVRAEPLVELPGRLRRFGRLIVETALPPAVPPPGWGSTLKKLVACGIFVRRSLVVTAPVAWIWFSPKAITLDPAGETPRINEPVTTMSLPSVSLLGAVLSSALSAVCASAVVDRARAKYAEPSLSAVATPAVREIMRFIPEASPH